MPLFDVRCPQGHEAEIWAKPDERTVPCTVCGAATERLWRTRAIVRDEIVGGFVQEHFGHQPEVFYSQSAMLKRANELGLRPMVRNAGPHDRHVSKWATVDLEAATALVSRSSKASDPEPVCETAAFSVKEVA